MGRNRNRISFVRMTILASAVRLGYSFPGGLTKCASIRKYVIVHPLWDRFYLQWHRDFSFIAVHGNEYFWPRNLHHVIFIDF
jgi:hypothetical protein